MDFAAACGIAGMKISTSKTDVPHLLRNPVHYSLQAGHALLKQVEKFKYLGVAFTSDGRQDKKLDVQSGKASARMRALHHSAVLKRELSRNTACRESINIKSLLLRIERFLLRWFGHVSRTTKGRFFEQTLYAAGSDRKKPVGQPLTSWLDKSRILV